MLYDDLAGVHAHALAPHVALQVVVGHGDAELDVTAHVDQAAVGRQNNYNWM